MVRRDLIGIEEQLLERYPELAALHAAAIRAGAREVTAVIDRFDAIGETDSEAFVAQVSVVQRAAVEAYAASVRGLLPESEVARWIAARDTMRLSTYDALLSDVRAPGVASLLYGLEAVPVDAVTCGDQATLDQMLAAVEDKCTCGYASSRVVPKRTCYFCAHAITEAWAAEERRLLVDGMLATWRELATHAAHDYRPIARSIAKRWKRTGLGTARLSTLTLPGNPEVKARMTERAQTR